jgi:hypothetical protein
MRLSSWPGESLNCVSSFWAALALAFLSISRRAECKSSLLPDWVLAWNSASSFSRFSCFYLINRSRFAWSLFLLSSADSTADCFSAKAFSVYSLFSLRISAMDLPSSAGFFDVWSASKSSNSLKAPATKAFFFCYCKKSTSRAPWPPLRTGGRSGRFYLGALLAFFYSSSNFSMKFDSCTIGYGTGFWTTWGYNISYFKAASYYY